jgi:hypothetical protein
MIYQTDTGMAVNKLSRYPQPWHIINTYKTAEVSEREKPHYDVNSFLSSLEAVLSPHRLSKCSQEGLHFYCGSIIRRCSVCVRILSKDTFLDLSVGWMALYVVSGFVSFGKK